MSAIIMGNKPEFCTEVDIRYWLQYEVVKDVWIDYYVFGLQGFKSEKSALRAFKKVENRTDYRYRVIKRTKMTDLKTTTEIEVLNEN